MVIVCLFEVYRPSREFFSLIWIRHHCRWRAAHFLTYARHSWPLSSEGSLTCHTYLPFIMVISENPWHSHRGSRVFGSGAVTTCFQDLGLSGIEPRSPACEANALPLRHRSGYSKYIFCPKLHIVKWSLNDAQVCITNFLKCAYHVKSIWYPNKKIKNDHFQNLYYSLFDYGVHFTRKSFEYSVHFTRNFSLFFLQNGCMYHWSQTWKNISL